MLRWIIRLSQREDKLDDLRELARAGWTQKRIAAALGVTQPSVYEALRRHRIRHVTAPGRRVSAPPWKIAAEAQAE